jgi:hypothetical protein
MNDLSLSKFLEGKKSSVVLLTGKIGSGKTTLLKGLLNDSALYFRCDLQHDRIQLPRFVRSYNNTNQSKVSQDITWEKFFDLVFQNPNPEKKLVVMFDDFQNLVKSNAAVMTIIQDAWQKFGSKNNVLFIASGSSKPEMDMIRERMTTLLKPTEIKVHNIDSVPFSEFKNYFAGLPIETIVSFYAVTGGVPKFFRLLDKDKDIFENIRNFLSNPTIVAYLDPRIMLNYDFHDPTTYFSIMQVLSMEEAKIGLLAKRLSLRTHNLTSFLDRLRELDLIDRILPGTDENPDKSRKGKYRVIEPFYRFWFRYVYSNQEFLMTNKIDVIINQIKEDYPNLMKRTMISILQEEMRGKNELFDTYTVSNWWEKDRFIEILALGERDVLFGTVYWKDTPITPTELHSLIQESHFVAVPRRIRRDNYLLFSKGGFTKELEKEAKKKTETVVLYSLDNI